MSAPNTLQRTAHADEQTYADIIGASDEVYKALAAQHRLPISIVHRIGLCVDASALMIGELRGKGHNAGPATSPSWPYHLYVTLPSQLSDERVVVDPTWQQFLDKELIIPDLPKVLIGTSDEVIAAASHYGVKERELGVYPPL